MYEELRQHYRRLTRKPEKWLFPAGVYHTSDDPIESKVLWNACRSAAERAGIRKPVHPYPEALCRIPDYAELAAQHAH